MLLSDASASRRHIAFAMMVAAVTLTLIASMATRLAGQVAPPDSSSLDLGDLPLSFEQNVGPGPVPGASFLTRTGGGMVYFAGSEVVLTVAAPPQDSGSWSEHDKSVAPLATNPSRKGLRHERPITPDVVRIRFVGANPSPDMQSGALLPGTVSYFRGNNRANWVLGHPTFAGITYKDLYPGIELRYDGTHRQLKGTYTVTPGSDPAQIRWRYEGGASTTIDGVGNLQITLNRSRVTEGVPIAWQVRDGQKREIEASYAIAADGTISFALESYDHSLPLEIDPTLTYSTFLGGSGGEYGYSIAVDGQGYVYVTGATSSTDFPVVNPIYPASPNGDLFVTKINPDATAIVYSTYIGGEYSDVGFGIAVDGAGRAYVTGETYSFGFPSVNAFQPEHACYPSIQADAIMLRLNPSGTALEYSTFLGDCGDDQARDVAVDSQGSAYITGYTLSYFFPLANPFQPTLRGIQDGFVTKFSPDGSALIFSTFLGGSTDLDYSNGIAVDAQGGVYVAGFTGATDFPLHNPIQPTNHGNGDTFITKFNPSGTSLAYSTYLGGADNDIQYSGLAVDPAGNAYVSGYTSSTDFPVANAYQSTKNGFEDVFLTKVNSAGTAWVYSNYLGGIFPDGDYHTDVVADAQGNAYIAGNTRSSDFPLVNSIQTGNIDSSYDDVFVTKFSPSGQELVYSTRLGGNNGGAFYNLDRLIGMALDAAGNVYITGVTDSPQYPTTTGVFQPTKAANIDAFVSKISAQGPNTATPTVTGTPPTATPTPCNASANYTVTEETGESIIPGTQDIGNHCESCVTPFTLPFPVRLYDRTFTSALIGNHGSVGFIANQNFGTSQCLPPTSPPMFNYAILPFWTEVRTDGYGITCPAGGCGIFTSITGSAPNRTLHIEWRGSRFSGGNFGYVNFELRLFEGSPNFQVIYGQIYSSWENGATIGAQKDLGSLYVQYACNMPGITPGTSLTFSLPNCGTPPEGTPSPTPTITRTPPSTATSTLTRTGTPPTSTPTSTNTQSPVRTATFTRTGIPTGSPTGLPSTSTLTPASTATACPLHFTDVLPTDAFYPYVRCMVCRGIISGYTSGCETGNPCFRPGNNITRAQLSKIVSNAAGLAGTPGPQRFEDVLPDDVFFLYVQRLAATGAIGGYTCGGQGEPCVPPGNLPYFRPARVATRGQITKIVSTAANITDPPGSQRFQDVTPGSTFYDFVQRLANLGVMSGYSCGGPGELCVPPLNLSYFRPNSNATRGQLSKIAANTFFPGCQTPGNYARTTAHE